MKKLAMAVAVMGLASMAGAYEIEGNPDRRVSLGVNYDHQTDDAEYTYLRWKITDYTKVTGNHILVDTKIPLSSFLTFQARVGFNRVESEFYTSETIKTKGMSFGGGFRVYLP